MLIWVCLMCFLYCLGFGLRFADWFWGLQLLFVVGDLVLGGWLWYSLLFEFVFNDALAGLLCGDGLVCFLVSVGGLILCSFICGLVCYCDLLLVF